MNRDENRIRPASAAPWGDYVIRVEQAPADIAPARWDALLAQQAHATPFMRHAYLAALHESGCAGPATGWNPCYVTLEQGGELVAACPLYRKTHSRGEYVFDQGWAQAYARHGLAYYPKALIAVPYTPVPGTRLLARSASARLALIQAVLAWCQGAELSSLHLLFGSPEDLTCCDTAGLRQRHTVQFHWTNAAPHTGKPYRDFEDLLGHLAQEKRKKVRQERRKVREAGVQFRWCAAADIGAADWDFFYRCYERTYLEHGNPPYLNREFFHRVAQSLQPHWLLFVAERDGRPIATSLIALYADQTGPVAYGRYWGAIERVDSLHFEACYYQPLQWCIAHAYARFEGGAQGEHKMARALLPVRASSAHWLAHPEFAVAVADFLQHEEQAVDGYLEALAAHSPLRRDLVRSDDGGA